MDKIEYVLKKEVNPILKDGGTKLVSDRGAFGIELSYQVNRYKVLFTIGKFKICSPVAHATEWKIYLRPLKKFWSEERGRLPKHEWGQKTHPLCGIVFWWEIKYDRGQSSVPMLIEQMTDHALIKRLRAVDTTFCFYK